MLTNACHQRWEGALLVEIKCGFFVRLKLPCLFGDGLFDVACDHQNDRMDPGWETCFEKSDFIGENVARVNSQ